MAISLKNLLGNRNQLNPSGSGGGGGAASSFSGTSQTFTGGTGANSVLFPDNLAEALWFGEAANRYLRFVSTNASESVQFDKDLASNANFFSGGRSTFYGWRIWDGNGYLEGATAHAGGGQGSATTLAYGVTYVTTVATAGDSVVLRADAGAASAETWVYNVAAVNAMDLFPPVGGAINGGIVDVAISVPAGYFAICRNRAANGTWHVSVEPIASLDAENGVTATGSDQAGARLMIHRITRATGGATTTGHRLPAGRPAGEVWTLVNDAFPSPGVSFATYHSVYPATGEQIYGRAVNQSTLVSGAQASSFLSIGGGLWRELPINLKGDHSSQMFGYFANFYDTATFFNGVTVSTGGTLDVSVAANFTSTTTIGSGGTLRDRKIPTSQTTDLTLTDSLCGKNYNNTGASAAMVFTLPTPVAGQIYRARVTVAQYVRFTATNSAVIYLGTSVSAANGFIRSNALGSTIELEAQSTTVWVATSITGTWTVDV